MNAGEGQGPATPLAPSTKFTVRLCKGPASALTWYSPGRTKCPVPLQPGDEVLRSQETRRTAGLPLAITIMLEPAPLTQSAELQMRRLPEVMRTDTNLAPMLKRQGWLSRETACTAKRGVLPGSYQYCGDETVSVTLPRVHNVPAEARVCLAARCFECTAVARGEGERAWAAGSVLTCGGVGLAAPVLPPGEA